MDGLDAALAAALSRPAGAAHLTALADEHLTALAGEVLEAARPEPERVLVAAATA